MKYIGMPLGMLLLYRESFRKNLVNILGMSETESERIAKQADSLYRSIILKLPEFEKGDRFKMNLVNCALFISFLQSMEQKPTVEKLTEYYSKSMMNKPTVWFCRMCGLNKFSKKDIEDMKKSAALNAADRNPYSWNMEYIPYPNDSGYEARFTKCGICTLMTEYGLGMYIPAMCHLDYDMSDAGGVSDFIREYTLASGGPYCDCGFKKKS